MAGIRRSSGSFAWGESGAELISDRIITDLGGKMRVMELMGHENADVRYNALMTVQRLMSQHV